MSFFVQGCSVIVMGVVKGIGLVIVCYLEEVGVYVVFVDSDEVVFEVELGSVVWIEGLVCVFVGDLGQKLMLVNLVLVMIDVFDCIDILVNVYCMVQFCDLLVVNDELLGDMLCENMILGLKLLQMVVRCMVVQVEVDFENEVLQNGVIVNLILLVVDWLQLQMLVYFIVSVVQVQVMWLLVMVLVFWCIWVNGVVFGLIMLNQLQMSLCEDL